MVMDQREGAGRRDQSERQIGRLLAELDTQGSEFERRLHILQRDLAERLSAASEEKAALAKELAAGQSALSELEDRLAQADVAIQQAETMHAAETATQGAALGDLETRYAKLTLDFDRERSELETRLASADLALHRAQAQTEQLTVRLKIESQELSRLVGRLGRVQQDAVRLQTECDQTTEQLRSATAYGRRIKEELAGATATLSAVREDRSKLAGELDASQARATELKAQLSSQGLTFDLERSNLEHRLADADIALQRARSGIDSLSSRLEQEFAETSRLTEQLSDARDERARLVLERDRAAESLREAANNLSYLGAELGETRDREREIGFEARLRGYQTPWRPRDGVPFLSRPLASGAIARCVRRGSWADAERWCACLLQAKAPDARLLGLYGRVLEAQGELGFAATAYRRSIALAGGELDIAVSLARVLGALERDAEASEVLASASPEAVYASLRDLATPAPRGAMNGPIRLYGLLMAKQAAKACRWELAARRYETLLLNAPNNTSWWVQFGHALKESGDLTRALAAYLTALRLDPGRADIHLQLGHAFKLSAMPGGAERAYSRAFELRPSNAHTRLELEASGQSPDKLTEIVLAAKARPPALSKLGMLEIFEMLAAKAAAKSRNWRLAARFYRRLLSANPGSWPNWLQLGHALKEQGDPSGAEGAYLQALALKPDEADAHLQLGHALKLQHRLEEAVAAYARASRLNPGSVDARREWEATSRALPHPGPPDLIPRPLDGAHMTETMAPEAKLSPADSVEEATTLRERLGLSRREAQYWGRIASALGDQAPL
jgi:cytochrome c-type biogenesis protein CcmH/NrfG